MSFRCVVNNWLPLLIYVILLILYHICSGPRNPGGSIPVLHSGSRNNSITENIKVSQSRVNNPNSQTSTSLHVPFLNADTAPNYIDIHAMMKAAQIESIPFLDTVKAEISYRAIKQAWNTGKIIIFSNYFGSANSTVRCIKNCIIFVLSL